MRLLYMALIFVSVFIVAVLLIINVSNKKKVTLRTKKTKPKTARQKKKRAGVATGTTLALGGLSGFFLYNQYGLIALLAIALVVTAIIITIVNSAVGGIGSFLKPKPKPKYTPRTLMDDDNVRQELIDQLEREGYENDPETDPVYHSWVDASEEEDTEYDTPTGRTPI